MAEENTPPGTEESGTGDTVAMSSDNWMEFIPEDIRDDPSISKYTSFEAFARGHKSAVGMIGKDKFTIPETDEQFSDIYGRLGRPDEASGYALTTPDSVKETQKFTDEFDTTLTTKMHGLGLNGTQAQGMSDFLYGMVVSSGSDGAAADEAANAEALTELKATYGANVDKHVDASMRIVRELGGDGAEELITKSDLMQNPVLVKILSGIANKVLEDTGLSGGEQGATVADIKSEITEAMGHAAYTDGKHIEHKQQVQKVFALRQKLQGIAA